MIVSLCIVAKDEQKHLPNLIKSINDQDFETFPSLNDFYKIGPDRFIFAATINMSKSRNMIIICLVKQKILNLIKKKIIHLFKMNWK